MEKEIFSEFESNKPKVELWLPHGEDAKKLFKVYKEKVKEYSINDWSKSNYNPKTKEIYGMSHIEQAVYNYILKDSGFRAALNEDNKYGNVFRLIKGKYYAEFNSLCVSPEKPVYERNNGIWKKAMELGEEKFGKVKNKFRINGFYYLPDGTEKGYGVKIVPAENFEVIEDETLRLDNGVSRFYLFRVSDLYSWVGVLAFSDDIGRVVLRKSRTENKKFS